MTPIIYTIILPGRGKILTTAAKLDDILMKNPAMLFQDQQIRITIERTLSEKGH